MLLRQEEQFNDLSPKLRTHLEKKVADFGKVVRYKFDISNENPDPQKHDGKLIWPSRWTLDPAVFYITDTYEDRDGHSKTKRIGMIDTVENQQGRLVVTKFHKVRIHGKDAGILKLQVQEIEEDRQFAMYLELHPKLMGGEFSDKSKRQIFTRIDEVAASTEARTIRTAKTKATITAQGMNLKEVKDFADAMSGGGNNVEWDSTEDEGILRDKIESLAETTPVFFNDLVAGKNIEYQALIKQAMDKNVITFNPAEYSFVYSGNNQPLVTLSPNGEKNEIEKMAEWLQTGGAESYKKIKSLMGNK